MQSRRRIAPKLFLLLCLVFTLLLNSNILPALATGNQTTGPKLCAVTPDQLEGQGLNVTSLGLNITPLGLNITPLGLNVTSLGLSVTSLGLNVTSLGQTPEQVVTDIATNVVTPAWLTQLLPNIQGGPGYNSIKTAILVVDDFSSPTAHGYDVRKVFTDVLGAVSPAPNVTVHNVDISSGQIGFEAPAIAPLIRSQIQTLEAQGYNHFVVNMSFGLLPCSDTTDVKLTDTESGQKFTVKKDFSLDQFEAARQQTLSDQDEKIIPILECIVRNGPWDYTAYFGYYNENSTSVTIPVGHKNSFFPLPMDRGQTTTFAPGRQDFAFSIRYNGSNQAWILKGPDGWGRTAIAGNSLLQKCYIRGLTPPPEGTLNITPVGYGLNQYLTEQLGIPENFTDEYLTYLASAGQENDTTGIQGLMREYLQRSYNEQQDSNPDTIFNLIPVASSGNFRHLFGNTPLRPSLYPEIIAVGGTLGDFGNKWILSHSGNILAPAAGYPFAYDAEGRLARIGAGTSYASPFVGALSSLWLTYPHACTFGAGLPPLANFATSKFAEATARVNQPSPLNCAVPVEEPPQADLAITKSAAPDPVIAGQPLTYTLTVTNNGEDSATNVVVTDSLADGVTASSVTPSQGSCEGTVCSLGNLNSGSSATVIIVVTAPATATISNTASVTSDTADPNLANNTASTTTNIQIVLPVIAITKTAPATVTLGSEFVYTVTITNNGSRPIINLTILDAMPTNAQYDWTTHEACVWAGPTLSCYVGTVLPGESKTIEFGMTATQLGNVTNTATVVANEPENGGPVNNSATVVTNVIAADADGDGYADGSDNCPAVWNDQTDSDNDSIGDLCDSTPVYVEPVTEEVPPAIETVPETNTQPESSTETQVAEGTEEAPAQ